MRSIAPIKWLVGGPFVGALLYVAAYGYFSSARSNLQGILESERVQVSQEWLNKTSLQKQQAQKELLAKKLDLKEKWEAALGGPTELASKDPLLSITAMIEATAKACSSPGTKVSLTVERFTEFTLTLEPPPNVTRAEMAAAGACLLRHCGPYLQRVEFRRKLELLAELPPQMLARISDWKQLQPQTVEPLLTKPTGEGFITASHEPRQPRNDAINLSPEEQKLQLAEDEFHALFASHFASCRELIRKQDVAVNLAAVRSPFELESRVKALEAAEPRLKKAQAFFEQPEKEYETILSKAGLDTLVIRVTTRGYVDSTRMQNAHLLFIFDKLMERQAAAKNLLRTMHKFSGQWTAAEDSERIQFNQTQAQEAYLSVFGEYEAATTVLDQALKSMPTKKGSG